MHGQVAKFCDKLIPWRMIQRDPELRDIPYLPSNECNSAEHNLISDQLTIVSMYAFSLKLAYTPKTSIYSYPEPLIVTSATWRGTARRRWRLLQATQQRLPPRVDEIEYFTYTRAQDISYASWQLARTFL